MRSNSKFNRLARIVLLAIAVPLLSAERSLAATSFAAPGGASSGSGARPVVGIVVDDPDPTGIRYIRRLIHRPLTSPPESERDVVVSPRKPAMSHESRLSAFIEWIHENLARRSRPSR